MLKITSRNVVETEKTGYVLAKTINAGDVVALSGELGAGKTAFVRGLARGLGFDGDVTSPTYATVHQYSGKVNIFHFDMYRINDKDSLHSIGFYDYLDESSVIAIEWSENIEFALSKKRINITLTYGQQENERIILIENIKETE